MRASCRRTSRRTLASMGWVGMPPPPSSRGGGGGGGGGAPPPPPPHAGGYGAPQAGGFFGGGGMPPPMHHGAGRRCPPGRGGPPPPAGPPGSGAFFSSNSSAAGGGGTPSLPLPPSAKPPPPPPPPRSAPGAPSSSKENRGDKKRPEETEEQARLRREKRKQEEKKREEEKREKEEKRRRLLETIPLSSDVAGAARKLEVGDFAMPFAFDGAMPPLPSEPKLIEIDFDRSKFVRFRYDSKAESEAKYELLAEPHLGITIDLVDPNAYDKAPEAELAPEDAQLLSAAAFAQATGEKRSASAGAKSMRNEVTWLRKTPILGNNLYDAVHKQQKAPIERQHVVNQHRELATHGDVPTLYGQLLENIDKTFADAEAITLRSVRHPTNESLTPVSVLPVLPDEVCWENTYVQATFDVDPSLAMAGDLEAAYGRDRVGKALVRQFRNSERKNFLAYLLPSAEGEAEGAAEGEGGADGADGAPVELEWVRDYTFDVKGSDKGGDSYFLAVSDEAAVYNAIEGRIMLTRGAFMPIAERPTRVTLTRREIDEAEQSELDSRRMMLLAQPKVLQIEDRSQPQAEQGAAAGAEDAAGEDAEEDPFGGADGSGGGGGTSAGADDDGLLVEEDEED